MMNLSKRQKSLSAVFLIFILMIFSSCKKKDETPKAAASPNIEYPLPPLPEDKAYERLNQIVSSIVSTDPGPGHELRGEEDYHEDPTNGCDSDLYRGSFSSNCQAFLTANEKVLKDFDQWLGEPGDFHLKRPNNLGLHSRRPLVRVGKTGYSEAGQFGGRLLPLSTLLLARSLETIERGSGDFFLQNIETLFALGDYLLQNPIGYGNIALAEVIVSRGLKILQERMLSQNLESKLLQLLPSSDSIAAALRIAAGGEWWSANERLLETSGDLKNLPKSVIDRKMAKRAKKITAQDVDQKTQDQTESILKILEQIKTSEDLATYVRQNESEEIGRFSQPPGQIPKPSNDRLASYFLRNAMKAGDLIDQLEGTRIIIAGRSFFRETKKWPTQQSDLVPQYLQKWPAGFETGAPIPWTEDKLGIQLPGRKGVQDKELQTLLLKPNP